MTTTITARCHCGSFTYKVTYPQSALPIDRSLCLCNGCRQRTGSAGGVSNIAVPPNQIPNPSEFNVTAYKSSAECMRYFCSVCGATTFFIEQNQEGPAWSALATGLWDKTEGIIKWNGCKWVEDTLDGGVSVWFNEITCADGSKRPLKRWLLTDQGGREELVPENSFRTLEKKPSSEKLKAQCHCGGVKFYVTRPNEASKKVQSPFPDLMIPYHSQSNANPENKPWWLRANDTKYLAGTCTCTSCRKNLGGEIQTWAFIPKCNIFKTDDTPIDFEFGTLKSYSSSEGVTREFCRKCGATVFWRCDWRPDLIDVGVGLFDPQEGARVEGWLDWWTDRVSFTEMAVSKSLIASLEDGLRIWGKRQNVEV